MVDRLEFKTVMRINLALVFNGFNSFFKILLHGLTLDFKHWTNCNS